jgi:hypothetical protein
VKVNSAVGADTGFTVRATATDGSGVTQTRDVTVTAAKASKVTAVFAEGEPNTIYINPTETTKGSTRIIATANNLTEISFKSSNTKAAVIEDVHYDSETGQTAAVIKAVGKGTTKITSTATDGSGKKATLTVYVKELVSSIEVTGQKNIVLGNKSTYKATVLGAKASNRKFKWSLGADAPEGVTISSSGVVTVNKNAVSAAGKTVTVTATALDESGVTGICPVFIMGAKTTEILIEAEQDSMIEGVHIPEYSPAGDLTNVRFYNTKFTDDDECNENQVVLTGTGIPYEAAYVRLNWKSSNTSVAEVYEVGDRECRVVGKSAGTATITCTADDGSRASASVNVTVIAPASSIAIPAGADIQSDVYHASNLTFGATYSFTAALGDLYGEPAVKQVNWDYEVGTYTGSGRFTPLENSEEAKENQLLFTFADGTLTVKDRDQYIEDLEELGVTVGSGDNIPYYAVKITASTTDGTGYSAVKYVKVAEAAPEIFMMRSGKLVTTATMTLSKYQKEDGTIDKTKAYEGGVLKQFKDEQYVEYSTSVKLSVVSSDTNVVTPYLYSRSGENGTERVLRLYPTGKGTATVTISTRDGSGHKMELAVKVQ